MSPMFDDRLAKIREQLNAGQAISLDDSRFLLRSIDRLSSALRQLLQRYADDRQDEV
jgi:ribosome assembly protein YihI (activator of Der GTPase)